MPIFPDEVPALSLEERLGKMSVSLGVPKLLSGPVLDYTAIASSLGPKVAMAKI